MASLTPFVFKKLQLDDKTWNVKIRVSHKSSARYIETNLFVGIKDLNKDDSIKSNWIIEHAAELLKKYNNHLYEIRHDLPSMSANDVKDSLIDLDKPKEKKLFIDFIAFIKGYIETQKKLNKDTGTFRAVHYALIDYAGETLDVNLITSKWLKLFDEYLRSPRTIVRINQGKDKTYKKKGLEDRGVHNRMRDFRSLFNKAKAKFNDEEIGKILIPNDPFKKYVVPELPESADRDLEIDQVLSIREIEVLTVDQIKEHKRWLVDNGITLAQDSRKYILEGSRDQLAKDLYMLSFYLCGMNAADMYRFTDSINPRIDYQRKKTETRRKDKGFISINIIPEALPIYKKYAGKLSKRYANHQYLATAINFGMKRIGLLIGVEGLDFYSARYSFGSWARNKCRISTDDIARAMNHKDNTNSTTDIYISKDWSIVDDVQRRVVDLLDSIA